MPIDKQIGFPMLKAKFACLKDTIFLPFIHADLIFVEVSYRCKLLKPWLSILSVVYFSWPESIISCDDNVPCV